MAQAIVEDFEEFAFHDPDLDVDIPVRVPKKFAESAKRGYGRRAYHDRSITYLKNADPVLRPLIEDGRINALLPLIQAALANPAYGEYVAGGYERLRKGQPLIEQAIDEAKAAHQQAAAAPADIQFDVNDPLADLGRPYVAPLQSRLDETSSRLAAYEQERQKAIETQQQQAELAQRQNEAFRSAHADLTNLAPDLFNVQQGVNDQNFQRALRYAHEAGYTNQYDLRAAVVFGGQAIYAMEQERRMATGSPAAAALAQTDANLVDAARREAAATARTVSGGKTAGIPQPQQVPPKPTPKNPDGTLKPKDKFISEITAWHQTYDPRFQSA
jgi:hypothetical protein